MKKLAGVFFLVAIVIYFLTSAGPTPYDYFTRLSLSFLKGRIFLTDNPSWLNELIPASGIYFVPYPPMPAILAMPFVAIWISFQQQFLAHILGAAVVGLTVLLSWNVKKSIKLAVWSGLLVGFGSIIWFLSSNGSVWYLGQVTAAFFMTAALVEGTGKKRPFVLGLFVGGAYLSRIHTILVLPVLLYLLKDTKYVRKYLYFFLGLTPFLLFNFWYNWTRFGVVWDKGYLLIPGVLNEPWYQKGLFNISYIPNHLRVIFGALPVFKDTLPFVIPSWSGLAIWITTPAFVYALTSKFKTGLVKATWLSIFLISVVIFSHGTTGFAQFGYRFAVDFYPLLTFLTIKGVSRTGLKWHHWLLMSIGVGVNLWGVILINKFNLVTF